MIAGSYSEERRALTPRMIDVARCDDRGLTVRQTAAELAIAPATVASVRRALCARLGVPNVRAATHELRRRGELL